jgi:hypothetical protein
MIRVQTVRRRYDVSPYNQAPKEIRWAIFEALTDKIGAELKRKGVTEKDVLKDFKEWRSQHGKARR